MPASCGPVSKSTGAGGVGGGGSKMSGAHSSAHAHIHWVAFAEQHTYTHIPSLGSDQVAQFWEEIVIALGISQLCGLGRDSNCIPYYLWRGPSHSPDTGSVYCIHYTVPDMREMQTSLKQKADTHTHTHLEIKFVPMHSINIKTFIL